MVCTRSGIANECVIHLENAYVVDYKDCDSIYLGLITLLENNDLKEKLMDNAPKSVTNYTVDNKFNLLRDLYNE